MEKFCISRDPKLYEAWPDVVLTPSGKLVAVFCECTHHGDRSYSRIMLTDSVDRGRTWSPRRPLTEATGPGEAYWNCPRLSLLRDGRLAALLDRVPAGKENDCSSRAVHYLLFSSDEGASWSEPVLLPTRGIVPDKLLELESGRWIVSAHYFTEGFLTQFLWWSDDRGKTWSSRTVLARQPGLNLCEVSILPLGGGVLAAFLRENSWRGYDCKKVLSFDGGEHWGEITDFPLPACHRPVSGSLADGRILITYRFMPGGRGWPGGWTQNFFAALTDRDSVLSTERNMAAVRILPVDYDRSPHSDLGYSGWAEFPDGEIYVVNYIVDDAVDRGQIRGYSLHISDFLL